MSSHLTEIVRIQARLRHSARGGPPDGRSRSEVCRKQLDGLDTVLRMDMIGSRTRSLPAPPHVVFGDLCQPARPGQRQWLRLLEDEVRPRIVDSTPHSEVVWSSLWVARPDALVQFELWRSSGTTLRWSLYVEPPAPDPVVRLHMAKRVGDLVFNNLQMSYGQ